MSGNSFLTSTQLSRRYQRTQRTIARWIKLRPSGFPEPVWLNGRNLWPEDKIIAWERSLASKVTEDA